MAPRVTEAFSKRPDRKMAPSLAHHSEMLFCDQFIQPEDFYINPVCGVPVQKSTAKHVLEYQGEKVYFCC